MVYDRVLVQTRWVSGASLVVEEVPIGLCKNTLLLRVRITKIRWCIYV